MNADSWAVIVSPVTTLLAALGGYWLAGRNDDARDQRAAVREERARRDAFAERLEEDRHTFQRDTLLDLQDQLQRLVRNTAQILAQDQRTIKETGQVYTLAGDLSDQGTQINVSVSRLQSRVVDDQLRAAIREFSSLCTDLQIRLTAEYPRGKVQDDQREDAIEKLQRQTVRMANAYGALAELLGTHLRRELDRRYLVAARQPDQGARS